MSANKYKVLDETIVTINKSTGQRELKLEYLEQILDDIAECRGGYSICRGGLILIDTVTGAKRLITSANGVTTNTLITD